MARSSVSELAIHQRPLFMTDIPEDEPLDPQVEAIRRKMVRLLAVSGGIMAVGLMTVLIAVVYRVNSGDAPAAESAKGSGEPVAVTVPANATISAARADDTGMSMTLTLDNGATEIRRFDTAGRLVGRYVVVSE